MKKIILIYYILLLGSFSGYSQNTPERGDYHTYEALKKHGDFHGYNFRNEREGYISIDQKNSYNILFQTLNGGTTWDEYSKIPVDSLYHEKLKVYFKYGINLSKITFVNDFVWYGVQFGLGGNFSTNNMCMLYKTTDAGKTWTRINNMSSFGAYEEESQKLFFKDISTTQQGIPENSPFIENDIKKHRENYSFYKKKCEEIHLITENGKRRTEIKYVDCEQPLFLKDFIASSINFVNENVGYIGGSYNHETESESDRIPIIAKTIDGGKTFSVVIKNSNFK